jgi:hypothetical protein
VRVKKDKKSPRIKKKVMTRGKQGRDLIAIDPLYRKQLPRINHFYMVLQDEFIVTWPP